MKIHLLCASALFVALLTGSARASDGNIEGIYLAKMGLSSLSRMSDAEGHAIRGTNGWHIVAHSAGASYANGGKGSKVFGKGSVGNFDFISETTSYAHTIHSNSKKGFTYGGFSIPNFVR